MRARMCSAQSAYGHTYDHICEREELSYRRWTDSVNNDRLPNTGYIPASVMLYIIAGYPPFLTSDTDIHKITSVSIEPTAEGSFVCDALHSEMRYLLTATCVASS